MTKHTAVHTNWLDHHIHCVVPIWWIRVDSMGAGLSKPHSDKLNSDLSIYSV